MEQENLKDTVNNEPKNTEKKANKKKKVLFILIPILFLLILGMIGVYAYLTVYNLPSNVVVKNNGYHQIQVTWDYLSDNYNYQVILSSKEFIAEDVTEQLKENKTLDDNFEVIDIEGKKEITIDHVLSNTDYYIAVIAYRESDNRRVYSNLSKIVKEHTEALEVTPITDLSAEEITDKTIKLKWTNWITEEKNLDNTDIEISYTIYSVDMQNNEYTEIQSNIQENEYTISELVPFSKYYYCIVINAMVDGQMVTSEKSQVLETMTKSEPIANITAKSTGTSSISVTWDQYNKMDLKNDDGSDISIAYTIYGSDSQEEEFNVLSENITDTSYTESNLPENKTRYYYVIANITLNNEIYGSAKCEVVSATTDITKTNSNVRSSNSSSSNSSSSSSSSNSSNGNSSSGTTTASKTAQARAVAKQIASSITGSTDLEKVSKAAKIVSGYYYKGVHSETGSDYYTAYGVFIKGESSCAGCTRALGMVLEEMGYSWKHVNENQWTHQWVELTMDGQVGYADGQVGLAGYGTYPFM